jgi:hypothetical protein
MKEWIKQHKLLLGLGIPVGLVGLLLVAGTLLLQTSTFKNYVRNQITMTANQSLNGELSVGSVDGSLIRSVRLNDILLRNDAGELLAWVPEATASYSVTGLASGVISVDSVRVSKPLLVAEMTDRGLNWSNLMKPSEDESKSSWSILVEELRVDGGDIVYLDRTVGNRDQPRFDNLSNGIAAFPNSRELSFLESEAAERTPAKPAPPSWSVIRQFSLRAGAQIRPDSTGGTIRSLKFDFDTPLQRRKLSFELANLKGRLEGPKVEASLASVNLEDRNLLNVLEFSGESLSSPEERTASLAVDRVGLPVTLDEEFAIDLPLIASPYIGAQIEVGGEKIDGEITAGCADGGGTATLNGSTTLGTTPGPTYDANLKVDALQVARCVEGLKQTRLHGEVSFSGAGIPYREGTDLSLKAGFTDSMVLGFPLGKIKMKTDTKGREVAVDNLDVESSKLKLSASGQLSPDLTFEGKLNLDGRLRGTTLAERVPVSMGQTSLSATVKGQLGNLPVEPKEPLEAISLDADWSARDMSYGSSRVGMTEGQFSFRCGEFDGVVCKKGFSSKSSGRIRQVTAMDLRLQRTSWKAAVQGRIEKMPTNPAEWGELTDSLDATLNAELSGSHYGGNRVEKATLDVDSKLRNVDKLNVVFDGRSIKAGQTNVSHLELFGSIRHDNSYSLKLNTEDPWKQLPASVEVNGRFELGKESIAVSSGYIEGIGFRYDLVSSAGPLRMTPVAVQTNGFEIRGPEGTASLAGRVPFDRQKKSKFRFKLQNLSLAPANQFVSEPDFTAVRLSLGLESHGSRARPDLSGDLTLSGLTYADYGPFTLDSDYELANTRATVDWGVSANDPEMRLLEGEFSIPLGRSFPAQFQVPEDESIEANLRLPETPIAVYERFVPPLRQYGVTGRLQMSMNLSGSLRQPELMGGWTVSGAGTSGRVLGSSYEVEDVNWQTRIRLNSKAESTGQVHGVTSSLKWRGSRVFGLKIDTPFSLGALREKLQSSKNPVQAVREYFRPRRYEASVVFENFEFGKLPVGYLDDSEAEGKVSMNLDSSGTWGQPNGSVAVNLEDFGLNRFRDIYVSLNAKLEDWVLSLEELTFDWDGDRIVSGKGQLPLAFLFEQRSAGLATLPADLNFKLNRLEIAKLAAFDYTFARIKGEFSGHLKIDGRLGDLEPSGGFNIYDTEFGQGRLGDISLNFARNRDVLELALAATVSNKELFGLSGKLPLNFNVVSAWYDNRFIQEDRPMNLQLQADEMPLEELIPEKLVDDYVREVSGDFSSSARIHGPLSDLQLDGRLDLEDGEVTLPTIGRQFTSIGLRVEFDGQQIHLKRLHVEDSPGSVDVNGRLTLAELKPKTFDFFVETKEFNIAGLAGNMEAYIGSKINIEGQLDPKLNKIEVKTEKFAIHLPKSQSKAVYPTALNSDIKVRRNGVSWGLNPRLLVLTEGSRQPQTRTEIHFETGDNAWLYHPNAEINFNSDLVIRMAEGEQRITGEIDTVTGKLEFVGKEFSIPKKQGAIQFNGLSPPVPTLDIEARYEIARGIAAGIGEATSGVPHIKIAVRGASNDPQLELTSDPAMSETEIIFVLVTGRPPSNAKAGEEESAASQAVSAASGLFSGLIQQELSGSIPVDVLRLQTGKEGLKDSRLQIGTYLSSNVFVSYYYQFGFGDGDKESTHIGQMEYRFAPRWEWETRYTDTGAGSVFVFWDIY